jgi:ATP-binding cassette subfamily B protein
MQEDVQTAGKEQAVDFNQDIQFKSIFFAYQDENWVLKDINLTINRGTTVAFVGATGAGKTSIVNLLGRFYEYQRGEVYVGDTDLKNIELNHLRKNIAIVLQDVFLFSDTVLNNITLGDPDITREQVIAASKAVGAHEFISKLPDGYQTVIGENGSTLSGGECQRLSIARALLKDAPVILLDEATASLDVDNETEIQNAISKLVKGKTVLIIAHRMRTVEAADNIVVLSDGIVAENGTHEELMKENGLYHRLVDLQTASANWKLSV